MLAATCRVCRRTLLQSLASCPWRCIQACGLSSVPGGPLLVVHPRDKPSAHLQVGMRQLPPLLLATRATRAYPHHTCELLPNVHRLNGADRLRPLVAAPWTHHASPERCRVRAVPAASRTSCPMVATCAAMLRVWLGSHRAASAQEALRLAETYAGEACAHVKVGPARGGAHAPATYLGSGAVAELAQRCAAAAPSRRAPALGCS